jgi:hypothetical protein
MLARLAALATPADRAVIEGLSGQLALAGQYRYAEARDLAESLRESHRLNKEKREQIEERLDDLGESILNKMELRWPDLHNRWTPEVDRILREEAAAVVSAIKSDRRYAEFDRLYAEYNDLSSKDEALEARWARCRRLMQTLERVALAHNLEKVAEPEVIETYKAMIGAENGTLGGGRRTDK